jgi:hypothetical protein
MSLLREDQIPALIADLKAVGLVNITYGDSKGMMCGNPLSANQKILEIDIGTEEEAWAINRAKTALDRGDEVMAHKLLSTLCNGQQATRH